MRDILFRGKDETTGEMIYGHFLDTGERIIISGCPEGKFDEDFYHDVIPETIGQYTGLEDKNGLKIFEGDIIKSHYANCKRCDHIETVVFNEGKFMAEERFSKTGTSWCNLPTKTRIIEPWWDKEKPVYMDYCEVIGNIHDNPELLKEGA
jgi:uncharacterized phage protein (TIGR01671 family)